MKRSALVGVKLAVSAALLAYLFSSTDTGALEQRVRSADLLLLAAAVFSYFAMLAIATWRWRLLLETLGVEAPLRRLMSSYLVATFFNNFLPSNIGGDVVRVRDGSRLTGSTTASLAVVGIDRVLGFGALYALAATAFVLGGQVERQLAGARVVLAGLALVFLALAYVFFRPGTARRLLAASRLDRFRAPIAVDVLRVLGEADGDPELAEALDRWELSLFQNEPFRSEQLRAALAALLGETWTMRACLLLSDDVKAREELHAELAAFSEGDPAGPAVADAARRVLVTVLRSGDRTELVRDLDRELLGLPRRSAAYAIAI